MTTQIPRIVRKIVEYAHWAPSADNSQPWKFGWDAPVLNVYYDSERVGDLTFPPEAPATLLSFGALLEAVREATAQTGIEAKAQLYPQGDARLDHIAAITFPAADNANPSADLADPIRGTNRFAYQGRAIPASITSAAESYGNEIVSVKCVTTRGDIKTVGSLVSEASRIRFQTKEIHEWLGKSLRFTRAAIEAGDGLDVNTIDLPPGGQHFLRYVADWEHMNALNRVGMFSVMAAIDSHPVTKAPAVVAISGERSRNGALEAGKILYRVWSYLNQQGIAVHPYYVISDMVARLEEHELAPKFTDKVVYIRDEIKQLLDLGESRTMHMLLRIGYPKKPTPVKSRRLPLDHVLSSAN